MTAYERHFIDIGKPRLEMENFITRIYSQSLTMT